MATQAETLLALAWEVWQDAIHKTRLRSDSLSTGTARLVASMNAHRAVRAAYLKADLNVDPEDPETFRPRDEATVELVRADSEVRKLRQLVRDLHHDRAVALSREVAAYQDFEDAYGTFLEADDALDGLEAGDDDYFPEDDG